MNWLLFWLENFRIALVVVIIYLLNTRMTNRQDKHVEHHLKRIEKELETIVTKKVKHK
jgi:hypothetical protein